MRSGDGVLQLRGNMNEREAEISNCHYMNGLRLAALCSITGPATELIFDS